jgi:nucleotide-binding universal stress UspA family protein
MVAMNKILVGVDGSTSSTKAVAAAADIASRLGASISLIHVTAEIDYSRFGPTSKTPDGATMDCDKFNEGKKVLDDLKIPYDTICVRGNPAKMLVEQAKKYDLLVLGTRGEGQVAEFLMGSVSSRAAHHSTVPVLLIP